MVMQVRRTLSVGAVPTGLAEGQISVGMADQSPIAWVGVPASVNPAGVIPITGLVRTVAGAPQPAGALGQLWWDEDAAQLFVYTGSEWVVAVNPPLPDVSVFAKSTTATTAPSSPASGDFWFNPSTGHLLLWNGTDWVSTVYQIPGVTDGSNSAPGDVGEAITTGYVNITLPVASFIQGISTYGSIGTMALPAGDWDTHCNGWLNWSSTGGGVQYYRAWLTEVSTPLNAPQGPDPNNAWVGNQYGTLPFFEGVTLGPIRINSATATAADFRLNLGLTATGTVLFQYCIYARRMR